MTDLPLHLLDGLASKSEQVRYIIGGNKDEYLLPEELLNDAFYFCKRVKSSPTWLSLDHEKQKSILRLEAALNMRSDCLDRYTHATIAELVERDADWAALRDSATDVLSRFGVETPD